MNEPIEPRRRGGDAPRTEAPLRPGADRVLLLALVLAVAGVFVWLAGNILLVIFTGILFAIGLDGLASGLARRTRLPRKPALAIVAVVFFGSIAGMAVLLVPRVVGQIDQIVELFAGAWESAQSILSRWGWPDLMDVEEVDQEQMMDMVGGLAGPLATITMSAVAIAGSPFVIIALAFFTAYDPALYRRGLLALLPTGHARVAHALSGVGEALRWWFLGQLMSMAVLAVAVSGGLWLLGVELWLSLGVLTGVLTFIPILGPIIAGVPILIVAFAEGTSTGLSVLAFYLVIQNLEGNLLVPFVQYRVVHMPPALLISTQVLLGALLGLPGFILAAPLAVTGMILVQRLWVSPKDGPEDEDGTEETPEDKGR